MNLYQKENDLISAPGAPAMSFVASGADPVWASFCSQVDEFNETVAITAAQHCRVGKKYHKCDNGPCAPDGQRSRREWCGNCKRIF